MLTMDVFDAIEKRASIRSFIDKQLTDKELDTILYAAERSPRIGSLDLVVLQDKEVIKRISDAAKYEMIASGGWNRSRALTKDYQPLYGAPTVILMCGHPEQPFLQTTIGITVGLMIMAATALGLGSVTVSSIRHGLHSAVGPELKKLIGLSQTEEVILCLAIGTTDKQKGHEMKGAAKNNVRLIR